VLGRRPRSARRNERRKGPEPPDSRAPVRYTSHYTLAAGQREAKPGVPKVLRDMNPYLPHFGARFPKYTICGSRSDSYRRATPSNLYGEGPGWAYVLEEVVKPAASPVIEGPDS